MDTISDNPSGGPTGSTYFIMENAALKAEIERLRERCEAYKGQVKAGAEEIELLRAALKEIAEWAAADPFTSGEIARKALNGPTGDGR